MSASGSSPITTSLVQAVKPCHQPYSTPMIRCDQVQWSLLGISLAGFNFLISVPAALLIMALLARNSRSA